MSAERTETPKRSIVKALTYRLVIVCLDFLAIYILRKLDWIERNQERGQRDGDFLVEAFAVFVQISLAHTPRLADADKPSAEQSALQRFREYAEHVAEKVAEGGTFLGHLVRENVSDGETAASEPTARPRGGAR